MISIARGVISFKLPIGVATRYKVGDSESKLFCLYIFEKMSVEEFMDRVRQKLMALPDYPTIEKSKILAVFRSEGKLLTDRPVKTVETEKLKEFSDRNQFARKKTDPRKRLVVYEFSRISNEVQLEIDEAIKNILRKLPE